MANATQNNSAINLARLERVKKFLAETNRTPTEFGKSLGLHSADMTAFLRGKSISSRVTDALDEFFAANNGGNGHSIMELRSSLLTERDALQAEIDRIEGLRKRAADLDDAIQATSHLVPNEEA